MSQRRGQDLPSGTELRRLQAEVDEELDRLNSTLPPDDPADPEAEEYRARLHSLHEAVDAIEMSEGGDDES